VFSPECRSTFNGLSAAAGKLGALTGASLFEPAANRLGDSSVMLLCAAIALLALIITKLFVPASLYHGHHHIGSARHHTHVRVPVDSEIT
jgi:MFS transporter, PHS family, inorganic phosphate transporter